MDTFDEVYTRLLKAIKEKRLEEEIKSLEIQGYKSGQLDCLLNPEKYSPIIKWEKCDCGKNKDQECLNSCKFDALSFSEDGDISIDKEKCVGCEECEKACKNKKFKINKEVIPVIKLLASRENPVYAIIAPAFVGQFGSNISPGQIRSALKKIGFMGMVEVALFADILTLREALEFDRNIHNQNDFQLTSCCCPVWMAMIRRIYKKLIPHVPPAVSPMIACGRTIKKLHPNAKVVFLGPCMAKKSEAREKDLLGAVDYVLTFREVNELFEFMDLDINEFTSCEKEHSSAAGRMYARSGGVSEAVLRTFEKIKRNKDIELKPCRADGVKACKKMLDDIMQGDIKGNFFEGMGCEGGCVGGPRAIINKEEGAEKVNSYSQNSAYKTPAENPYVIKLLNKLGFKDIESLMNDNELFTRKFD